WWEVQGRYAYWRKKNVRCVSMCQRETSPHSEGATTRIYSAYVSANLACEGTRDTCGKSDEISSKKYR
ncbi:hypothetical protein U1Q18_050486, partial [Sarracenia purpurea var. burkii]